MGSHGHSRLRVDLIAGNIMAELPLGRADYFRGVAKEARIQTRNRYYESNPVLTDSQTALIARPGLKRFIYVGNGPIRAVYTQPGDFNEALFVISGTEWYRVDLDGTVTLLQGGIANLGTPSMAATGPIGTTPEYLFMADGAELYLYMANAYATGIISGSPANSDVIAIGTQVYYQFTNGSVDAGAPDGSIANPWLVSLGSGDSDAWENFANAINVLGNAGTDYSTATQANPLVQAFSFLANSVSVRATAVGALGNDVATTETGSGIAWGSATLTGGGGPLVTQVQTPGDVGVISLGYIASYVVVIPAQGDDSTINGRFFWIEPGETTIDPLDFATAERAPDPVYNVIVFGDQFWLPGSNTTEVWYFTGNINAPVQRLQGVTFDRGTWAGTALQVKESMIIVDSDGGVFQVAGGLNRISNPSVEERIRKAIATQAANVP